MVRSIRFITYHIRKLLAAALIASFVLGAISAGKAIPQAKAKANANGAPATQTAGPTGPAPICR